MSLTYIFLQLKYSPWIFLPDFQVCLGVEICRQLLDEGEQHRLMQGAVGLAEQLLGVDLLAQLDDQQQVRGGKRLLEGFVELALVHEVENGGELRLRVDARLGRLGSGVQVRGMFAQRTAYRFGHRLTRRANDIFLHANGKLFALVSLNFESIIQCIVFEEEPQV